MTRPVGPAPVEKVASESTSNSKGDGIKCATLPNPALSAALLSSLPDPNREYPTLRWWQLVCNQYPETVNHCAILEKAAANLHQGPMATFALCRLGLKSLLAATKFLVPWENEFKHLQQAESHSGICHYFLGRALALTEHFFVESRGGLPFEFDGETFPSAHHAAKAFIDRCHSQASMQQNYCYPEESLQLEKEMEKELLRVRVAMREKKEWDEEFERLNAPYICRELGNEEGLGCPISGNDANATETTKPPLASTAPHIGEDAEAARLRQREKDRRMKNTSRTQLRKLAPAELRAMSPIAIVTIREDEEKAVLKRFPVAAVCEEVPCSISYLRVANGYHVVAITRCSRQGTNEAQKVTETLIREVAPKWIIAVGIAGGIPDTEFSLGDVLLASQVVDLTLGAIKSGEQEYSVSGGRVHEKVERLLRSLPGRELELRGWNTQKSIKVRRPEITIAAATCYGDDEFQEKVRESLRANLGGGARPPKYTVRPIVSSNHLVQDIEQGLEEVLATLRGNRDGVRRRLSRSTGTWNGRLRSSSSHDTRYKRPCRAET